MEKLILVGIGATLFMDLWALLMRLTFKVPLLDYGLVGRWVLYMPAQFRHRDITTASPRPAEKVLGWLVHYLTGIGFALAFGAIVGNLWLPSPTLMPAIIFGIATVVFPFFLLQPALGIGIAASKLPQPHFARLQSLVAHASFGAGLYIAGVLVSVL